MRCSQCATDNPPQNNFCAQCGNILSTVCEKCGAANPATSNFCGNCGTPLATKQPLPAVNSEPIDTQAPSVERGERRHLTVLFCDLVGSTEIAAQLDPEEWREVVAGYHRSAADAITRFGGKVAKYLGDGIMAYFGWPAAHDNDAERAARAGLAIIDTLSILNEQAPPPLPSPMSNNGGGDRRPKLVARVGIDSGAVVVGTGAGPDADVFGEAPNIAARVQAAAAPGTVLITAATHRLISGLFVVETLGPRELKGVPTSVELFQVVRPTGVRGRLAAARGLTPFVGREEELRLLLGRWQRAREGEGQLALVVGEAGIGKSRLVAEFRERIRDTPHIWMESAGEQFFENSPFHALTEMLSQWLQLQGGANAGDTLERLERALTSAGLKLEEAVPLVAELLQIPVGERYPPLTLIPEQKRRRLFAVLMGWVFGAARLQPVVMVVEDLYWLDPSTLELLQLLAEQSATVPLMLLYTARPEFRASWPMRAHHAQITLNRLRACEVREMIALVSAHNTLASESVDTVIERTGGVPLFVEELTRAVLESGNTKWTGREIPVTLHDSLMARLDRLGSAKEVIQIGAVIGGEFSYELLRAVHPRTELDLQVALAKLADAELLYVRGIVPDATYQFKHALIRDTAYEALLKSHRRELHRQVAHTIDKEFPVLKEAHPEVLARHWTEAGETESAIAEWQKAGKTAEGRNAFTEALGSYRQANALLKLLAESPERELRELELAQSIVRLLMLTAGYSASETIDAIEQAAALVEKSGSLKQLFNLLISQALSFLAAGNLQAAIALADRALELALREGSPVRVARAYSFQLTVRYYVGDLAGVEKHFTAGLKFFEAPSVMRLGEITVLAFAVGSWNAWILGRADVARDREARMMAAGNANPYTMALSALYAGILRRHMREYEQAEAGAAQALELSEQHQFTWSAAVARGDLGAARAQLGRVTEGIVLIRRGIAEMLEVGSRIGITISTASLAAALERQGAIVEALETVEQALQLNPDEIIYRPENLRMRGELRLKQGHTELAEADFREAIVLAQKMGAKAYELRTTMSLARLLASNGRRDQAQVMLAEIYNWFTKGFDTRDLKDAKAQLDELSA
ncbi:MAG: AAA family ATPase [Deltaproteobacteria bacterium]|nr:AAA family ATPase [Deltaproteobacteria bacterium]